MILSALIGFTMFAINESRPVVKLWPAGNPGGWSRPDKEISEIVKGGDFMQLKAISEPTLEVFRAKGANANAPTVIILPGGGYYVSAIEHEGWEIATRLNLAGINAAVLKYRIPNREDSPRHKVALEDGQRAIRLIRQRGAEFGVSTTKVGIMGFSAGGHAAAITSTASVDAYAATDEADKLSPRPDFTVLIYPAYLNQESTLNLSPGLNIDKNTPQTFIVQAMDDGISIDGALAYTHACRAAHVPVELHLFPKGGHGYGLRTKAPGLEKWPDLLIEWLRRLEAK